VCVCVSVCECVCVYITICHNLFKHPLILSYNLLLDTCTYGLIVQQPFSLIRSNDENEDALEEIV